MVVEEPPNSAQDPDGHGILSLWTLDTAAAELELNADSLLLDQQLHDSLAPSTGLRSSPSNSHRRDEDTTMPCSDSIACPPEKITYTHMHVILASSGTHRTSGPLPRPSTHTLPHPVHSRRVAPSQAPDSGHWTWATGACIKMATVHALVQC